MKIRYLLGLFTISITVACEDTIDVDLKDADPVLVVDAWINDKPEEQHIKLTSTIPYFDERSQPGVANAKVIVSDDLGNIYKFTEVENGDYIWTPTALQPSIEATGRKFNLSVNANGTDYISSTSTRGVPQIDSITFTYEPASSFSDEYYYGQFWATDLEGEGDTYWIKTIKNGVVLNKPSEIGLAYDASFSKGGAFDGVTFIQPIRQTINPNEVDKNDMFISPYWPGDTVYVELHSISNNAFNYLERLQVATNRPGGFAELFAQPLSNLPTNIKNTDPNIENDVVGFFNVASVSGLGVRFEE